MSGFALSPAHTRLQGRPAARRPVAAQGGSTWFDWLATAMRLVSTRRDLAAMDDRMLKDIGVSRVDALAEANRAPWDMGPRGL